MSFEVAGLSRLSDAQGLKGAKRISGEKASAALISETSVDELFRLI